MGSERQRVREGQFERGIERGAMSERETMFLNLQKIWYYFLYNFMVRAKAKHNI